MPELPPVTRTFLPFSPGMASARETVGAAVDMVRSPWRTVVAAVGPSGRQAVTPRPAERLPPPWCIRWSTASPDHEAGLPRQPEGAPGGRSDRRAHCHRLRRRRVVL